MFEVSKCVVDCPFLYLKTLYTTMTLFSSVSSLPHTLSPMSNRHGIIYAFHCTLTHVITGPIFKGT